jgi:inosine/xanthosine triphosphatase
MHVFVASGNPVKIEAATAAFSQVFPSSQLQVTGQGVPSGVADQPVGETETLRGARQRMLGARELMPAADFWVGIEGGIRKLPAGYEAFAWMVVSDGQREGEARTAGFILPPAIGSLLDQGLELGEADDRIFGTLNSKQQNGAVGLLSGDRITRRSLYEPAIVLALLPFIRPELYLRGEMRKKR